MGFLAKKNGGGKSKLDKSWRRIGGRTFSLANSLSSDRDHPHARIRAFSFISYLLSSDTDQKDLSRRLGQQTAQRWQQRGRGLGSRVAYTGIRVQC